MREISTASTYSHYGQDGKLTYQSDLTTTPDERHVYVYLAGSLVAKRTLPVGGTIFMTYQHTDALGSPVATTDQAGTTITRERLTAYGEPADGTWQRGPGFTGHVMDPGSKLVYMQQRYYDPVVGRFLSSDPMPTSHVEGHHFNRYWYANGNSYRYDDPDGRCATLCTGAIGMGVGLLVGGGMEIWKQAREGRGFDGKEIAVQAGKGAVVGGLIGLTGGAAAATGASTASQVAATSATGFVAGAEAHNYAEVTMDREIPSLAESAQAGAYTAAGAGAGQFVGAVAKPVLTVVIPASASHPVTSLSGKVFNTAFTPAETITLSKTAELGGNGTGAVVEESLRMSTGSANE